MVVPVVTCLLLCVLAQADVFAAGHSAAVRNHEQSLMSLVVNQAVELQQLATQQQQQAASSKTQAAQMHEELRSLRDKVKSMETQQEWNVAKLKGLNGTEAFRAYVNMPVAANALIRFHTDYSTGKGQVNPYTGVYTVATPGVYLLGFQLFPNFKREFAIDLFVSGIVGIRSGCYTKRASCSASSVFHLRKGDTVWLQSTSSGVFYSKAHSYIFGVLISPDA